MKARGSRKWHKLLGLTLSIPLLLVTLSGGILVFKENIIALALPVENTAQPSSDKTAGKPQSYSIHTLSAGLAHILQRHSVADIYYLKTPTQGRQYWFVAARSGEAFLYDGTATILIPDRWRVLPLLHWLTDFHTELLVHDGGSILVSLIGLCVLLLMVLGLVSWWPGRTGFRLHHLTSWPTRRGAALRQHRALAILCLPLLLLSVVTGAGMSVQGAWGYLAGPAAEVDLTKPEMPLFDIKTLEHAELDKQLRRAQQQMPNRQITMLSLPEANKPLLGLRFRGVDEWHVNGKTNMRINLIDGDIQISDVQTASRARKILNTFYPLHASYGLPGFYKALVAITAVLTTALLMAGLFAWLRRRGGMLAT